MLGFGAPAAILIRRNNGRRLLLDEAERRRQSSRPPPMAEERQSYESDTTSVHVVSLYMYTGFNRDAVSVLSPGARQCVHDLRSRSWPEVLGAGEQIIIDNFEDFVRGPPPLAYVEPVQRTVPRSAGLDGSAATPAYFPPPPRKSRKEEQLFARRLARVVAGHTV
ncbi:unnamed protein product [Rangifer tarandus platyrhynchus]|uniref:Uncharacterized protein n=1 Tax=Rangifer tarandus platyrhynchus TaxID=3082113 RepID=A0ABN8XIA0_RANTA|nr:unnamed protein product [Rangifer tarandus platyrhynchus]